MLETINDYIDAKLVHSVHTSERRSFRGCRRRHDLIFRHGYYPVTTAKPLEFGVAFHKAMEKLYDPLTWNNRALATDLAKAIFVETCQEQFGKYQKAVKDGKVGLFQDMEEVKADYEERKALGLGMLKHYIKAEMPIHDVNFTPVKVEIEFEVPIESPQGDQLWCTCNRCWNRFKADPKGKAFIQADMLRRKDHSAGCPCVDENGYEESVRLDSWREHHWKGLPVTYGGRFDMLCRDQLGRYWIFDWKTTTRMTSGEPGADDDFMWMDDQISSYCWAMWKIGFPIAGFVYVELKKVAPEEPEPLSRPYKGRMYSTNKNTVCSTYDQYLTTVRENDPSAYANGYYDEFLKYLQEEFKFHKRHQIHRGEEELANIGENIWKEACDITDHNLRIYPSPGRFACNTCAFWDPCLMMNRGEDYTYTLETLYDKRERHYFEREPSTETKGGE